MEIRDSIENLFETAFDFTRAHASAVRETSLVLRHRKKGFSWMNAGVIIS